MDKKRVFAYYDGSNFYHYSRVNYGITAINYAHLTNNMLKLSSEDIVKIKYFNSPVNGQENPKGYASQQKFFAFLKQTPFLELYLGKLVERPLNNININCITCGHQESDSLNCPKCNKKILLSDCRKKSEKGVDVNLAIQMLLDALEDKYDTALLFSSDADFVPAIKYITKSLKKNIIYCHFPSSRTNELVQNCSEVRLITKDIIERSEI